MDFNFMSIIDEEKWNSFDNKEDLVTLSEEIPTLNILNRKIKNPDNPAKLEDVKLITYCK